MKKFLGILLTVMLSLSGFAQNSFYLGYENGGKWDKFHYINDKGYYLEQLQLDGVFSVNVGYRLKEYTIETGLQGFYTSSPFVSYNYTTSIPSKSNSSGGGSSMNSWIIPLRFGKDFKMCKNRFFVKPELAFTTIIARDYSNKQPKGGWGENISSPGDTSFVPTSPDSTRGYFYRTSKVNFGIETSLSLGYRFKEKADIYIKGSYHSSFNPLFYDTFTHYSATEIVKGTQTFTGTSLLLQIGLRYYFAKRK